MTTAAQTQFKMDDIPEDVRRALTRRAMQTTVQQYGAPAGRLFEQAQQMVASDHVVLTGRNQGRVYDDGWMLVTLTRCSHCSVSDPGVICAHKIAVAFADLLARHIPITQAASSPHPDGRQGNLAGMGVGGLGRLGGYSGGSRGKRLRPRKVPGKRNHCPKCGGFLDGAGACNKCGGV